METLDPEPYSTDDLMPLEADAGTLVLLHGTPLTGVPNTSSVAGTPTLHVIDGVADYPADNWLRRPRELPLRGFASLARHATPGDASGDRTLADGLNRPIFAHFFDIDGRRAGRPARS